MQEVEARSVLRKLFPNENPDDLMSFIRKKLYEIIHQCEPDQLDTVEQHFFPRQRGAQ